MAETIDRCHQDTTSISTFRKLCLILISLYIFISATIPIVLLLHPTAVNHLVFLNFVKTNSDFNQAELLGLHRVDNFYLDVGPEVRLGIWHFRSPLIENQSLADETNDIQRSSISTSSKIPIVLYLHGNAFDRSLFNRRALCEKLRSELKYDVFSMDYRGFGDSTGRPTEDGILEDVHFVYSWLQNVTKHQRKIYLWGHSLGSAIACQLAARLSNQQSQTLAGLVLEAPFINMHHFFRSHWFSWFFRWQPWFDSLMSKVLRESRLNFQTRGYLSSLNCSCVLLHADDDYTIPYFHSQQLLSAGLAARDDNRRMKKLLRFNIDLVSFYGSGYGHSSIYQHRKLLSILKRLIFNEHL